MAAVAITAIELGVDAEIDKVQFGEPVALGDSIYKNKSSSGKWFKADANVSAVTAGRDGIAIALHAVSADERWGVIVLKGTIFIDTLGVTALAETFIVGAAAAGDIAPVGDLVSGWYTTTLGVGATEGTSDTVDEFVMAPRISNQVKA